MSAKHLCVRWEGVSGEVHSSDHLSWRTFEEESTSTVKDSVTSEDAPVDLPRHLGTCARHLNNVLLAFDGALLWLNEEAYRAAGVARRMMARDLHIIDRDYISIGNALGRVNHIALVSITLSWLVVLSATNNMDTRVEASHLGVSHRVVIVLVSGENDIRCDLDTISCHEIDEFLRLGRVDDNAWRILQVASDVVTQVPQVTHHRDHVDLQAIIACICFDHIYL